jgi:hypothetical protein
MDDQQDHRAEIGRQARSAERWANLSMGLSSCALVLLALPLLLGIAVFIWVYLALR